jgi:hypothetical protein
MEFGPFPKRDIEEITRVLESLFIPFTVTTRSDILNEQEKSFQKAVVLENTYRMQGFDPSFLVIDVPDESIALIGSKLIKFGIDPEEKEFVEMRGEDYVCAKCGRTLPNADYCPAGHGPMLSFEIYARIKKLRFGKITKWFAALVLLAAIVSSIIDFLNRH